MNSHYICPLCGGPKGFYYLRCIKCRIFNTRTVIIQPADPTIRLIALTKGYTAVVSACRYEEANSFIWSTCLVLRPDGSISNVYAVRAERRNGKRYTQSLHRFLMGVTDPDIEIDHCDGDGLNCRDENLRIATPKQNQGNKRLQINNTSGYKGVHWFPQTQKWVVRIKREGKCIHLGYFFDKKDAARAYDRAAIEQFGEFAVLNLPEERPNYGTMTALAIGS